jgi:phenylacetate-CoA ligase
VTYELEERAYPVVYDERYFPEPGQPYWFPVRETMPAEEREVKILERLRAVMSYAYETGPFYRRKWDDAGIHPSSINSLEDFEKVPVTTKQELRDSQVRCGPFGDYLCVPESDASTSTAPRARPGVRLPSA